MRKQMNIYKRKDGRYKGRIPFGRDGSGKLEYKYLYSRKLSELCFEWLKSAKLRAKESSYYCYEKLVNKHILSYFKNIKYCDLNTQKINGFIEFLLKQSDRNKKGLSPKTVRDIIAAMRLVAKYAQQEYGYRNPMHNISMPKIEKSDIEILNKYERSRLQNYLQNNLTSTNLGILLTMYSGMRIGEVCALKWGDINFENGVIHVSKTVQRIKNSDETSKTKVVVGSPKSKTSERDIPIPKFLVGLLKNFSVNKNGFIMSNTSRPTEPRTIQNRFKSVLKKCGIRSVNFHFLRHTYATVCIENGIDPKTVSELLGHANVNITLNRYVHSNLELKKKYIENLNFTA